MILHVHVMNGRNISNGWQDYLDTPDPYILMRMRTAPDGKRRTTTKDNEVNPVWNERFDFLLDDAERNILQITLMEDNYGPDQTIGTVYFDTASLTMEKHETKTFIFNDTSEVDIEFMIEDDKHPTLRYSLCLCDEEKAFLTKRREKVFESMRNLLGDDGPKTLHEVPRIAVLGSGGGFRAMVAYSGVFKALYESGILQCSTYACGLSGSSWYLSTLYSHHDWPNMNPKRIINELKNNIDSKLIWLLGSFHRYLETILRKRNEGQPISFTDFFGHMVGETLLKDRMDSKLTHQQEKINDGDIPMPMYTCVHVKEDVSARSFQEWVEFSPYEIGMPKYGTFMKPEQFGSKFFMGKLCRQFEEPPLHFLQGIWGSAFCILFKRLLDDNRKLDPVEMIRQEMAKELENKDQNDVESDCSDDDDDDHDYEEIVTEMDGPFKKPQPQANSNHGNDASGKKKPVLRRMPSVKETKRKSYWRSLLTGVFDSKRFEVLHTRKGRAGVIHNFMRGLNLQKNYPVSPFTPRVPGSDVFDGIFDMHPTSVKHLYMVDAGLTFNSPFPLMLRPQRGIDIILSFDFSARPSDTSPPFKELLLAEKWAKMNHLKFPKIDTTVFDREGMKELYIFKDPKDPACPIVLHFVLVNIEFRNYSKPGVPRQTKEEKDFADFDIFDDQSTPYSTFNFTYTHEQFDRLSQLMEFNTLLHVDEIKQVMVERIESLAKRSCIPVCSSDVDKLPISDKRDKKKLKAYVKRAESFRCNSIEEEMPRKLILKPILKRPALKRQKEVSITSGVNGFTLDSPKIETMSDSQKLETEKRLRFKEESNSSGESDADARRKAFRREETQWYDANESMCSPDVFKSFDMGAESSPKD